MVGEAAKLSVSLVMVLLFFRVSLVGGVAAFIFVGGGVKDEICSL